MTTVHDADLRRNALALHKAFREAEKVFDDAGGEATDLPAECAARLEAEEERFEKESDALFAAHQKIKESIKAEYAASPSAGLHVAFLQAEAAYEAHASPALLEDWDGDAVLCAKTGIPLWETDEVVYDEETGEYFLRSALGLLPRKVLEEAA